MEYWRIRPLGRCTSIWAPGWKVGRCPSRAASSKPMTPSALVHLRLTTTVHGIAARNGDVGHGGEFGRDLVEGGLERLGRRLSGGGALEAVAQLGEGLVVVAQSVVMSGSGWAAGRGSRRGRHRRAGRNRWCRRRGRRGRAADRRAGHRARGAARAASTSSGAALTGMGRSGNQSPALGAGEGREGLVVIGGGPDRGQRPRAPDRSGSRCGGPGRRRDGRGYRCSRPSGWHSASRGTGT